MRRMATAMQGSISSVVMALMRMEAASELTPRLENITSTPACSKICGV